MYTRLKRPITEVIEDKIMGPQMHSFLFGCSEKEKTAEPVLKLQQATGNSRNKMSPLPALWAAKLQEIVSQQLNREGAPESRWTINYTD